MPIEVDAVVRADALTTSGGDMVQLEEYRARLDPERFDVRTVPFHPGMTLRSGAVVHIFNVDRPHDFLAAARVAEGHRRIVSPIHHNAARVTAMRRADRGRGVKSLVSRAMPDAAREWLGSARRAARGAGDVRGLRSAARMWAGSLLHAPAVWPAVGRTMDGFDAVALLAEGEGRDLQRLTGWSGRNGLLVPNGRPEAVPGFAAPEWERREPGSVLVVGRIEPRKRQLEVARAANRLQVPISFIGPLTDASTAYSQEFVSLAASSTSVAHLGAMGREEVLQHMGAARVLLNASWVEVQSLVDLEAAQLGCAVVTAGTGHSREWLGALVVDVPGGVDDLVRAAADRAAAGEPSPPSSSYAATWDAAAGRLAELYEG